MDGCVRLARPEALSLEMTDLGPQSLRENGERALRWIERYLAEPEHYRVLPKVSPGEIRHRLPAAPPQQAEAFAEIFDDFEEIIVPGLTHWNHPAFFGYFATSSSVPGIVAEMLSAAV